MTKLRDNWVVEREKYERIFVDSMHKMELIIVRDKAKNETWVKAIEMQQQTIDKLLKVIGLKTIDLRGELMPMLKRRNTRIIGLEKTKKEIEVTLHNILTIGDAYSMGDASIEELHMAKQEFDLVISQLGNHIKGEEE